MDLPRLGNKPWPLRLRLNECKLQTIIDSLQDEKQPDGDDPFSTVEPSPPGIPASYALGNHGVASGYGMDTVARFKHLNPVGVGG